MGRDSGRRTALPGECEGPWPIAMGRRGTKNPGRLGLDLHSTRWCDARVAAESMRPSAQRCHPFVDLGRGYEGPIDASDRLYLLPG